MNNLVVVMGNVSQSAGAVMVLQTVLMVMMKPVMPQPVQVMHSDVTTTSVSTTNGDVIWMMTVVIIVMKKHVVGVF